MLIAFSTKGHRMTARKDGHVPGNVPGKPEADGGRSHGDNCQVIGQKGGTIPLASTKVK